MHFVSIDRRNAIVSIRLTGFFKKPDAEHAADDLHKAIRSLGKRAGQHRTLYDLTEVQVATIDMVDHFAQYFSDSRFAGIWARKVAFVSESALLALQLKRVQGERQDMRTFPDRAGAMAWLLED